MAMNESKQKLIGDLTRTFEEVDMLAERIRREDIYLDGCACVDTGFLMAILTAVSRLMDASEKIAGAMGDLLGVDRGQSKNVNGKDEGGVTMSADEVLRQCTFADNILRLPNVQLNKKTYAQVKTRIEDAGGMWKGGKVQGFIFDFDASRVVSLLRKKGKCDLSKDFQFFETPSGLADWLVSLAGVSADDIVLEPSAGRGAIINAVHRVVPDLEVDYFELMPENRQFLSKMDKARFCGEDFTKGVPRLYTRIFANPPFSRNQDVRHMIAMYDALDFGGIMCAITSRHWKDSAERVCVEFRRWLEKNGAEIFAIPAGTFRASGTDVPTMAVKIKKQNSI